MKLQLDTSVQIHELLCPPDDPVNAQLNSLVGEADAVAASTYSKKEFAFSVIRDCCTMLARVHRKRSLRDALKFIDTYGSKKKRFRGRMLSVFWRFFIGETIRGNWPTYDATQRDRLLAEEFAKFLRIYIPELWESFGRAATQPLEDRTKCPFARRPPVDNGKTFDFATKRKCTDVYNCALPNLIRGEQKRGVRLLNVLRALNGSAKTDELRKIELVLERFLETGDRQICYEQCNQGIGDLVISIETPEGRTLVTTNAKESNVISPAIGQEHVVLRAGNAG